MYLNADHQALKPLFRRNWAYRQYSARLTTWLDRLALFVSSVHYASGKNVKPTNTFTRHPKTKASNADNSEENVINNHRDLHNLNNKATENFDRPTNQKIWFWWRTKNWPIESKHRRNLFRRLNEKLHTWTNKQFVWQKLNSIQSQKP